MQYFMKEYGCKGKVLYLTQGIAKENMYEKRVMLKEIKKDQREELEWKLWLQNYLVRKGVRCSKIYSHNKKVLFTGPKGNLFYIVEDLEGKPLQLNQSPTEQQIFQLGKELGYIHELLNTLPILDLLIEKIKPSVMIAEQMNWCIGGIKRDSVVFRGDYLVGFLDLSNLYYGDPKDDLVDVLKNFISDKSPNRSILTECLIEGYQVFRGWGDRELMDQLYTVPSVREFVQSLPVRLGRIILSRRLELGWSQEELAERIRQITGKVIQSHTISFIEGGTDMDCSVYGTVLNTLGMSSLDIKFVD